jgi:hypothetical protein
VSWRNRLAGARAQSIGKQLEQDVQTHVDVAKQLRLVEFSCHTEPRSAFRGKKLVHAAAGFADFSGHFVGAKVFAIESKARKHELRRAEISDSQQAHLAAVSRAGGLALLAVRIYERDRLVTAAIRWHEVPWRIQERGEKLQLADLAGHEIAHPCLLAPFVERCATCGRVEPRAPVGFQRRQCEGCLCARLARLPAAVGR